jgi:hypothetical protein
VPKSDKACPVKNNAVFFFQLILILYKYILVPAKTEFATLYAGTS